MSYTDLPVIFPTEPKHTGCIFSFFWETSFWSSLSPCSNQNWRSLGLRQGVTLGPQRHSALWGPLFLPSRVFFFLGFHLGLQEHMPQNLLEYGYIETNILKSCISENSFILPSCLTESFPGLAPSFRLILIFLQNCEEFVSFSSDFQ